jgi:hypothetical protein
VLEIQGSIEEIARNKCKEAFLKVKIAIYDERKRDVTHWIFGS